MKTLYVIFLALLPGVAVAQYRCNVNGQVVLQETSCVGAKTSSRPPVRDEDKTAAQIQAEFEREMAEKNRQPVKSQPVQGRPAPQVAADTSRDPMWIIQNQDLVKRKLRDPDSAQFSGAFVSRRSGSPVVCGFVNARNAFGGYAGHQRFVSAGPSLQVLGSDMQVGEMEKLWLKVCNDQL